MVGFLFLRAERNEDHIFPAPRLDLQKDSGRDAVKLAGVVPHLLVRHPVAEAGGCQTSGHEDDDGVADVVGAVRPGDDVTLVFASAQAVHLHRPVKLSEGVGKSYVQASVMFIVVSVHYKHSFLILCSWD